VDQADNKVDEAERDVSAVPPPSDRPLNPQDGAGAGNPDGDKYVISIKQVAKFVVGLGDRVSPTDVEEGMRVG
jgi:26S proteasome regulatory subunit T1